jgi:hypothetical protein
MREERKLKYLFLHLCFIITVKWLISEYVLSCPSPPPFPPGIVPLMLGILEFSDSQEKWGVEYPPASIAIHYNSKFLEPQEKWDVEYPPENIAILYNHQSVEIEGMVDFPKFPPVKTQTLGSQRYPDILKLGLGVHLVTTSILENYLFPKIEEK